MSVVAAEWAAAVAVSPPFTFQFSIFMVLRLGSANAWRTVSRISVYCARTVFFLLSNASEQK